MVVGGPHCTSYYLGPPCLINKFAQLPTQTSQSDSSSSPPKPIPKASIILFNLQLQSPLPHLQCRLQSKMMADPDNSYSSGGAGGNDWELVSLTASTYAAAPGPILPLLDAHKTDSPPPAPAPAAAAMFMSQHFSLPAQPHTPLPHYQQPFTPATSITDDARVTHLHISSSCAKNYDLEELDDTLTPSDFSHKHNKSVSTLDDALLADANGLGLPCSHPLASAHHVSAHAATDATAHLSCLTPPLPVGSDVAVSSGVACIAAKDQSKLPCQAWWKKTYSFLCNNAKESVTFRFIFVAATIAGLAILGQRDKLHLHKLSIQFHVDTEKISCSVGEPLGQVKGSVIIGGSPVAQG